jgi:hypothetical protein
MKTNHTLQISLLYSPVCPFPYLARLKSLLVLTAFLTGVLTGLAQPTILSTTPPNMATGVSPTASVIFVFSEPMNPAATIAQFMDFTSFPPAFLSASSVWSSGDTVLTCTPVPEWPANKMLAWIVTGENPEGEPLGETSGIFSTGDSGGNNCTNEVGTLTLGKGALYRQGSAAAPALQPEAPYLFIACAAVACSDLPVASISLGVPGGASRDLLLTRPPEFFSFLEIAGTQGELESRHPDGDYLFTLQTATGSLPFTVNFPPNLIMPGAPRLTDYAAVQAVDSSLPFVLDWDAFEGAGDDTCIHVEIYGEVFQTPFLGMPETLPGTARSVTIPAETFESNTAYEGAITFYHYVLSTNSGGYVELVYRSAVTEFTLATAGGAPTLSVQRVGDSIVISWPKSPTEWRLTETAGLSAQTVWQMISPGTYQTNAESVFVTIPAAASSSAFYRLEKP